VLQHVALSYSRLGHAASKISADFLEADSNFLTGCPTIDVKFVALILADCLPCSIIRVDGKIGNRASRFLQRNRLTGVRLRVSATSTVTTVGTRFDGFHTPALMGLEGVKLTGPCFAPRYITGGHTTRILIGLPTWWTERSDSHTLIPDLPDS
jgi:hypothetical protein